MRFQRGQSIVEFALVLPLFLLFTFSIIYFGCVFADYVTLGTIARSSARAASVLQQEDAAKQQQDYQTIRDGFHDQKLPFDIYEWNPSDTQYFDIQYKPPATSAPNGNVEVTVTANLQGVGKTLVDIVNGLTDSDNTGNLSITYTMYSEYNWSNKK